MTQHQPASALAIAALTLLGLSLATSVGADNSTPNLLTGAVPKATCGPGDRREGGLQGQTTPQERSSGDSKLGYRCNMQLVSQFRGEGAVSQRGPTYFHQCAYYGTNNNPLQQHLGVVVVDVSDRRNPKASAYLNDTAAIKNPHETLKAHVGRKILAGAESNGPNFAVYDLSADCRRPTLMASIQLPGSQAHMGNFTPDGLTYYVGQNNRGVGGSVYPVDLDDPAHPKALPPWQFLGDGRPHGMWFNDIGTIMYAGQPGLFGNTGTSAGPDGLVINDVSDYQFRRPNPQIQLVNKIFWSDQGQAEDMYPIFVKGRRYVVSTDENGGAGGTGGLAGACARGASAFGYPNIVDVTDLRNLSIVQRLQLEVSQASNCQALVSDPADVGAGTPEYNVERCVPDRDHDPKMLACTFHNAGLRIFDVRDLNHPREIAYYKSPAPRTDVLPGSGNWSPGVDLTVDRMAGSPHWVTVDLGRGRTDLEVWTVSDGNGFQVLRFTDRFRARNRELFEAR